ncbi:MAG: hypothetical protein ACKO0W_08365, partial [Planctomycetota bacterium]
MQGMSELGIGSGLDSSVGPRPLVGSAAYSALELLNGYAWVFLIAFVVTLVATPFVRKLAIEMEIVDKPNEARKQHKFPIAYLGGFAVFLGIIAAVGFSYTIV